jgi:hypothetical protein
MSDFQATDEKIDAIARVVNPSAFKMFEAMKLYCLRSGDSEETAERYAIMAYGRLVDEARETARSAFRAIAPIAAVQVLREAVERLTGHPSFGDDGWVRAELEMMIAEITAELETMIAEESAAGGKADRPSAPSGRPVRSEAATPRQREDT